MPRREIPFEENHYYHFYNRGNNRGAVFCKPENYLFFLRRWKKYVAPFVDTIAYCLMPTHYHFCVRVKDQTSEVWQTSEVSVTETVSKAMQKFGISYTKAINKRFDRTGALFEGAFQAKPIKSEKHLLHLCRYIHGNPVKDGLVADPADWAYSNYLEWLGQRDGTLYTPEFVREYFASPSDYRDFVFDDLRGRDLPDDIKRYLDDFEM